MLAGLINVMAGGGSLITLPVLLFLGFPAPLANGTNRIAIFVQNVVAVTSFKHQRISDFQTGSRLALATLPGAIIGARLAIEISDTAFRAILAVVLVLAVIGLFVRPPATSNDPGSTPAVTWFGYLLFFGIGFYGGFIQAGVGFLFLIVLYHVLHVDLVRVNMYKVFVIAVYTIPTLLVFVLSENVDWLVGFAMAGGSAIGAFVATQVSVKGGERSVRAVVAVVVVLMAVRLLWDL